MKEDTIMSLTGKEIAQMHKDYVMPGYEEETKAIQARLK